MKNFINFMKIYIINYHRQHLVQHPNYSSPCDSSRAVMHMFLTQIKHVMSLLSSLFLQKLKVCTAFWKVYMMHPFPALRYILEFIYYELVFDILIIWFLIFGYYDYYFVGNFSSRSDQKELKHLKLLKRFCSFEWKSWKNGC